MEHIFNLRQLAAKTCPDGKTLGVHYNDVINAFGGNINALDSKEIDGVIKQLDMSHKAAINHLKGLKRPKNK